MDETVESLRELLTLDELTDRVGLSVRNVRFYTTKGLVPPPIRRGRSGYYTPDHVARLELVQELQSHGFTLAAIERYCRGSPPTRHPEDIALHRTMLAPWQVRGAGGDEPRRARPPGQPDAHRRRPRHPRGPRDRAAHQAGPLPGRRSPSSRSGSACSTSASRPRRRSRPPTSTPSTAARSPRSSTTCSAPWSGRSTRSPAPRPRSCARSSSGSSRCRSPPWCGLRGRDGRGQAGGHRGASQRYDASCPRSTRTPLPAACGAATPRPSVLNCGPPLQRLTP